MFVICRLADEIMGVELSLMTTIPGEILKHVESTGELAYIDLASDANSTEAGPSRHGSPIAALVKLSQALDRSEEGMATRVTVHDLGSLDWGEITSHVCRPGLSSHHIRGS